MRRQWPEVPQKLTSIKWQTLMFHPWAGLFFVSFYKDYMYDWVEVGFLYTRKKLTVLCYDPVYLSVRL